MGQSEVLEILGNSKLPLSVKEISTQMGIREQTIAVTIKILEKHKEVEYIEINKDLAMKFFKCKRRMKLYYVS